MRSVRSTLRALLGPLPGLLLLGALAAPSTAQETPGEAAAALDPDSLPAIVAVVNGTQITREQLIEEADGAQRQLAALGDNRAKDLPFFERALDQIIAGRLLHQAARELGLAATPEEVDEQVEAIKRQYASEQAYLDNLAQEGMTEEDLRADLAQETSIRKYVTSHLRPSIQVSEEDLRAAYEANLESMPTVPAGVKTHHILVSLPREADEAATVAARERIEGILARARSGEDFAALARETSDDETAQNGGELPWLGRGQTLLEYEQAAFALEPMQLSEVVRTDVGFHVILCTGKREEHRATFEEIRPRLEQALIDDRVGDAVVEEVRALEEKASVERFL